MIPFPALYFGYIILLILIILLIVVERGEKHLLLHCCASFVARVGPKSIATKINSVVYP